MGVFFFPEPTKNAAVCREISTALTAALPLIGSAGTSTWASAGASAGARAGARASALRGGYRIENIN
jgi:hypothetical protein